MNGNGVKCAAARRPSGQGTGRGPRGWLQGAAPLVVLVIATAVVLAGCGGSASSGSTSGKSSRVTESRTEALKFSRCMRAHGISSYPDPNGQGTISVAARPGIDPTSPRFQRARRTCQSLDHGFNMDESNPREPNWACSAAGQSRA